MKNKFKFELGQRVLQVGVQGLLVISGRGVMNFISGGVLNMYQTERGYFAEYDLLTIEEFKELREI